MRLILFALLTIPHAVSAQTPLTTKEFEMRVMNRTLDFGYDGQTPYGIERYLPDRQVLWSWGDNRCEPGVWYEENGNICFKYDFNPTPQCWRYFDNNGQLVAVFMDEKNQPSSVLYELQPVKRQLVCDNFGS